MFFGDLWDTRNHDQQLKGMYLHLALGLLFGNLYLWGEHLHLCRVAPIQLKHVCVCLCLCLCVHTYIYTHTHLVDKIVCFHIAFPNILSVSFPLSVSSDLPVALSSLKPVSSLFNVSSSYHLCSFVPSPLQSFFPISIHIPFLVSLIHLVILAKHTHLKIQGYDPHVTFANRIEKNSLPAVHRTVSF